MRCFPHTHNETNRRISIWSLTFDDSHRRPIDASNRNRFDDRNPIGQTAVHDGAAGSVDAVGHQHRISRRRDTDCRLDIPRRRLPVGIGRDVRAGQRDIVDPGHGRGGCRHAQRRAPRGFVAHEVEGGYRVTVRRGRRHSGIVV